MKRSLKVATEVAENMLVLLSKQANQNNVFELPPDHKPGVVVPKGGSCCANCKYGNILNGEGHCSNQYFIKWNGGSKLPAPPDEYCSDWWEPK